jgi:hypothetical protein
LPAPEFLAPSLLLQPNTHSHSSTSPFAHQHPIKEHASHSPPLLDPTFDHSSDGLLDFYEDQLTDGSGSNPNLVRGLEFVHGIPNIFVTPIKDSPPWPIYFDSPTEDPIDSDPLRPGFEIDYGVLDFQWHPYFRTEDPETEKHGHSDPHRSNAAITNERSPSPSPFRFLADEVDDGAKHIFAATLKMDQHEKLEQPIA